MIPPNPHMAPMPHPPTPPPHPPRWGLQRVGTENCFRNSDFEKKVIRDNKNVNTNRQESSFMEAFLLYDPWKRIAAKFRSCWHTNHWKRTIRRRVMILVGFKLTYGTIWNHNIIWYPMAPYGTIRSGGGSFGVLVAFLLFSFGFPLVVGCLLVVLWCSVGVLVVFLWFSCGFPPVFFWFSSGCLLVVLWCSFDFPSVFLCFSSGFLLVFICFSSGFPLVFLCFSFGFPLLFLCLCFGFVSVFLCTSAIRGRRNFSHPTGLRNPVDF